MSKKRNEQKMPDRAALLRRKRRGRALLTFLLVLLLTLGTVLSLTVFFNIEEVVVQGSSRLYTNDEILGAANITKGDNLFLFSCSNAENAIWTKLPYIDKVKVTRQIPHTVVIDVSESSNSLCLPYSGGSLIVSDNLKILENVSGDAPQFTKIYGFQPKSFKAGAYLATDDENGTMYLQQLVDALSDNDMLTSISSINVSDKLNLRAVFEDRVFVLFGTASNLDYKVKMLKTVCTEKISAEETGYLDLSIAGKGTLKNTQFSVPSDYIAPAQV